MLVLTRKPRQQIRIAIDAPREVKIYRGEIYYAIQEENRQAAMPEGVDIKSLPKEI